MKSVATADTIERDLRQRLVVLEEERRVIRAMLKALEAKAVQRRRKAGA